MINTHRFKIENAKFVISFVFSRSLQTSPTFKNNVENQQQNNTQNCDIFPDQCGNVNPQKASLFFTDGVRSIDFVLVWKPVEDKVQEDLNCVKREIFEDNLVNEGLELERETIDEIHFTKIHTPIEVLRRYAEILKLRMPMIEVRYSKNIQHFLVYSI